MSRSLPIRAIIGSPSNRQAVAKLLTLMEQLMQPVDRRDLTEWRQFESVREDLIVVMGASAPKHVILSRVPNPAQQPEIYRNLLTERQHQVETYLDVAPPEAGEGFVRAKIAGNVRKTKQPILGQVLDLPDLEAALCVEPAATVPSPNGAQRTTKKRSTVPGEGRDKLIAVLTAHHQYAGGSCLNQEPIGNNELARLAGVSQSTASKFFNGKFKGYTRYKALCRDTSRLVVALKLLNDEFAPHHLLGEKAAAWADPKQDDDDSD